VNDNTSFDDVRSGATSSQRLLYWQRSKLILSTDLTSMQKLVMLSVSDHMGANTYSKAGVARHAQRCSVSERTVQRTLSQLLEAQLLEAKTCTGRPTWYSIRIDALQGRVPPTESHPRHSVTPDRESPPPDSVSPPPDSVSPKGDQEGDQEGDQKSDGLLTLSELISIPVGDTLSAVDGYRDAWAAWAAVRPGTQWRSVASVEALHAEMARAWLDGRDVVRALEQAAQKRYRSIRVGWMARRATSSTTDRPSTATPTPEQAWQRVDAALLRFGAHPPWLEDGWYFSEQPAIDAAYRAGVLAAAEITDGDTAQAWAVLYAGGNDQSILWQSRRFSNAFKKSIRGAA
jgi:hypothetical protein